jgi:hypothetical protein
LHFEGNPVGYLGLWAWSAALLNSMLGFMVTSPAAFELTFATRFGLDGDLSCLTSLFSKGKLFHHYFGNDSREAPCRSVSS